MSLARHTIDIAQSLDAIFTSDRSDIDKGYALLILFFQDRLNRPALVQPDVLYFEFPASSECLALVEQYLGLFKNNGVSIGSSFTLKNGPTNRCHIGVTINNDTITTLKQHAEQQAKAHQEADLARANRYYQLLFNRSRTIRHPSSTASESPKPPF